MNIITKRKIITEPTSNCCGTSSFDDYSNLTKDPADKKARREKWAKGIKGGYEKVKESGGLGFLESILGLGGATSKDNTDINTKDPNIDVKIKEPMSTQTKVLIGVGVAGVLGFAIWYFGIRNKSGK